MSNPTTADIKLDYPVQLADRKLEKITLRRPRMCDLLDNPIHGEGDISGELRLFAVLAGLQEEEMRQLDAEDYGKVQKQFITFQGKTKR